MNALEPQYIGDGVYAKWDGFSVVLTTGDHDDAKADNRIVFEPKVIEAFECYLAALRNHLRPQQTHP